MVLKIVKFLFIFCSATPLLFANPTTDFETANTAYQKGDYATAIAQYENILKSDNYSEGLYYNLGNAYFKTNNLGKSILYYEKALLAAPRDADILHNLEIAKAKTKDDLDQIGKFFLAAWWQGVHKSISASVWGILTLLSLWAGIAGFILWLFGSSRTHKKQGFIGGIALVLLSILLYFLGNSQANFEQNSRTAIVLENTIELKNGPDVQSTGVIDIHEGLKVELMDQIGDWYKVKLANGEEGWLPLNSLAEI
ncbi:MAG: tetratricopeptide repeat protein [Saprospiraceae bacterium]